MFRRIEGRSGDSPSSSSHVVSRKEAAVPGPSCIPVIPSANLERSLRLWVDGLGFTASSEMREDDKLVFCMLRKDASCFMLNRRAGTPVKPQGYEGIRLYWASEDLSGTRERLQRLGYHVSGLERRPYGQTEFVLTDDDGFSHCFGAPTQD
jgi:uncharacterized glyoxalase superfamily protein PhnB